MTRTGINLKTFRHLIKHYVIMFAPICNTPLYVTCPYICNITLPPHMMFDDRSYSGMTILGTLFSH